MYLTKFHKAILNEIWKTRKSKSKVDYNLDLFFEFYLQWYKKKYGKHIYTKGESNKTDRVFNAYLLAPENQYLIKYKYKREMILALSELASLLHELECKNLINIHERIHPRSKSKNRQECIPIFIGLDENNSEYEPFTEGLEKIREYLGKEILVREGFRKFRRFNYRTDDELLRIVIAFWIPFALLVIGRILEYFLNINKPK